MMGRNHYIPGLTLMSALFISLCFSKVLSCFSDVVKDVLQIEVNFTLLVMLNDKRS